jgi:hypothetical protein
MFCGTMTGLPGMTAEMARCGAAGEIVEAARRETDDQRHLPPGVKCFRRLRTGGRGRARCCDCN